MVFSPTCANWMKLKTQEGPSVALWISLCVQLSLLLCPENSSWLCHPRLPTSSPQLREVPGATGILPTSATAWTLAGSWGRHSTSGSSLLTSIVLVAPYILSRFLFLRSFFHFQVGKEVLSLLLHLWLEWKSFTCFCGQTQNHTQSQVRSSCADKISSITADFIFLTVPYLSL